MLFDLWPAGTKGYSAHLNNTLRCVIKWRRFLTTRNKNMFFRLYRWCYFKASFFFYVIHSSELARFLHVVSVKTTMTTFTQTAGPAWDNSDKCILKMPPAGFESSLLHREFWLSALRFFWSSQSKYLVWSIQTVLRYLQILRGANKTLVAEGVKTYSV